ncbi:MAG: excalibur calcium-binding domain-containing protein [Chloroflexia bacterium]|nr:excalibur calcium-binding domain-containing protein [Chloroflexia bacterium]
MTIMSRPPALIRRLAPISVVLGVALAVATAAILAVPGPALVLVQESPPLSCADFVTQRAAQALLDADPSYRPNVDPDDDGLACEDLPATLVLTTVAVPSDPSATVGATATPRPVATRTSAATATLRLAPTAEPTSTATVEPTATAIFEPTATVEPTATPDEGPTIITRGRPTATPADPAPIIAPDPGADDAPLYGRFGSSRQGFESIYGESVDAESDEYPDGFDYVVVGFDLINAAYHRDYVNALTITLSDPLSRDEAETLIEPFLPTDTQRAGVRVESQDGDIVVSATSAALVDRFGAATYALYGAEGPRGSFHYRLRGNDDGTYSAVELRLGTGRTSPARAAGTGETPTTDTSPGVDTAVATEATGTAPDERPAGAGAYLAAVRSDYDALIGSLAAFAALIGAPPAETSETYLAAIVAECAAWQNTYAAAGELVPPADYADLHTRYLAFAESLDAAATDIIAGVETDDPDAVESGITRVVEATDLIAGIDEALAAAEDAAE